MNRKLTIILVLALVLISFATGDVWAAPDPLGGGVHVVQWGENLATIAYRYGLPVEALAQANGITDPNLIYIGQQLVIPGGAQQPVAAAAAATAGPASVYRVQLGDTLTSIAGRFGCSVDALMAANGLPDSYIFVGQPLTVPGGGPAAATAPGQMAAAAVGPSPSAGPANAPVPMAQGPTHLVQPGETLSALAYRYGTTINDLMQANNLRDPWLVMQGQQLVVPGMAAQSFEQPAGTTYTVQVGDTLAGIALHYGTTVQTILQANNLSMAQSQFIQPGQQLVVPGTIKPSAPAPQPQMQQPASLAVTAQVAAPQIGNAAVQANNGLLISPAVPPESAAQPGVAMPQAAPASGVPLQSTMTSGPETGAASQAPLLGLASAPMIGAPGSAPVIMGAPGSPQVMMGGPEYQPAFPAGVLVSGAAPVVPTLTYKWEGRVVQQTFPEGSRYPSVLRVTVGGAKDMQVTVRKKDGNWSTTGFTGTKLEYGPGAVEFAPLNPGIHYVTLDGQGTTLRVSVKPNSLTYVEFSKVPANTGH